MAKQKKKKAKVKIIYRIPTELQLRIELEKKRLKVKQLIPYIEETGESTQDEGGETYTYTVASEVRKLYFDAFEKVGLSVSTFAAPHMMPTMEMKDGRIAIVGAFEICDTKTGFTVRGWAAGCGRNAFWALNTAQTLAMKQFLLGNFGANWRDIQDEEFHAADGKTVQEMTPEETVKAISDSAGEYMMLSKGKRDKLRAADKKTKKAVKKSTKKARK